MTKVDVIWNVRFEVTFYGVDKEGKSFREIKENTMKFDDNFEIPNKLPFDSKENVEITDLKHYDELPHLEEIEEALAAAEMKVRTIAFELNFFDF